MNYTEQTLKTLIELTAIPSPTGYTKTAAQFCSDKLKEMGFKPSFTKKYGVMCDLGGNPNDEALLLTAHIDTLGGMVSQIKSNGRLIIAPLGGLALNNIEAENCIVVTRCGKKYSGTLQLNNPSLHVNNEYRSIKREFDTMEIVLDEKTSSKKETQELEINVGDYVCFDPRTTVTESGYIKSRFLDDKLSVAMMLTLAGRIKDEKIQLKQHIILHITVYEEVGHGGAAIPNGISDILAIDMGCIGDGLSCDERMVSICAKDSRGPYDYDMTTELINCAKENNLAYAIDVYPSYGSDADAALSSGHDIRHGLVGPGIYASHGYERSHKDGIHNTFELIFAYVTSSHGQFAL